MIISHRHRLIFVHIPKTGGTSLTMALEPLLDPDDIELADTREGRKRRKLVDRSKARGRVWKHSTLADVEGLVDPTVFAACRIVTIIRNPWDRAVSLYHWSQRQKFENPAIALAKSLDFNDYIRHNLIRAMLSVPVSRYLTDSRGREYPAHLLRFEHLADDLDALTRRLDLPQLALPHANRSAHADYRGFYTAQTAEIIAAVAAEDIARFDWQFQPANH